MGHMAGLIFVVWAIAKDLVMRYEPQRRIWLSVVGQSAGFEYALWPIAHNQLSERRINNSIFNAC
jgi:hypothetical protein